MFTCNCIESVLYRQLQSMTATATLLNSIQPFYSEDNIGRIIIHDIFASFLRNVDTLNHLWKFEPQIDSSVTTMARRNTETPASQVPVMRNVVHGQWHELVVISSSPIIRGKGRRV